MAETNTSRTLADALGAVQPQSRPQPPSSPGNVHDPLVDRLATALTLLPQIDPAEFDDGDDELDLPILVQPLRPPMVVEPPAAALPRWREGRAALIGFGVGLVLLVPIGVTLSTRLPEQLVITASSSAPPPLAAFQPSAGTSDHIAVGTARRPPQPTAVPATLTYEDPIVLPREAPAVAVVVALPPAPPAPDHLAAATELIGKGDVAGARNALTPEDLETNPLAVFALAETFDPNVLAAWSARGVNADVDRARHLYRRALDNGVMKARQRLDALD